MLRNIALLTVSLLLGVIGAEVAMRVVGVGFPVISKPDPELGFVLRPGLAGWYGKEGGSRILINADGRRDRGFARARSPGTFRVAVLGDSFVLGLEVAEEKGVVASIERELVSCPALSGVAIEALNFGVSGYGTAQEYLMLKSRALGYAPDAVVLAVFAGNDLRNNVRTLQNDPVRPYFVLRENGLHPDDSYRSEVERRTRPSLIRDVTYLMLDHSVLAQSFNELRRSQLPGFGPSRSAGAAVVAEAGVDVEIYAPTAPEPWRQAWSIIEALVAAAAAEVKARDKAFVLATIGAAVETDPDPARRRALAAALGVADLEYPDTRFAALAARLDVGFVPLARAMRENAERSRTYFHGFKNTRLGTGHFNDAGHAFAGAAIAEAVCRTVARKASPSGGAARRG